MLSSHRHVRVGTLLSEPCGVVFAFRCYFPVTTMKSFKPVVFNADVHDLFTYHGRPHLVEEMVRIDPMEVLISFVLVLEITLLCHHLDASLLGVPNRPQVLGPDTRRHCTVAQICLNASIVLCLFLVLSGRFSLHGLCSNNIPLA